MILFRVEEERVIGVRFTFFMIVCSVVYFRERFVLKCFLSRCCVRV